MTNPTPKPQTTGSNQIFEWLETEVSAIDIWYRGSPSYERDASWMKDEVFRLLAHARKAFPDPASSNSAKVLAFVDKCEHEMLGKLDRDDAPADRAFGVLDKATEQKLRSALRFAASRSVMNSSDEERILAVLTAEGRNNG